MSSSFPKQVRMNEGAFGNFRSSLGLTEPSLYALRPFSLLTQSASEATGARNPSRAYESATTTSCRTSPSSEPRICESSARGPYHNINRPHPYYASVDTYTPHRTTPPSRKPLHTRLATAADCVPSQSRGRQPLSRNSPYHELPYHHIPSVLQKPYQYNEHSRLNRGRSEEPPSARDAAGQFFIPPYAVGGRHRITRLQTRSHESIGEEKQVDWDPNTSSGDSGRRQNVRSSPPRSPTHSYRSSSSDETATTAVQSPASEFLEFRDGADYPYKIRSSNLLGKGVLVPGEAERFERVFIAYLTYLCEHEDAKTLSGDDIHQSLMASKTRHLDVAGDFRPFRFRIQAFTTGFAEWLRDDQKRCSAGGVVSPREMKEFIWEHPLISRYNYDGKKSKSKGNHVWTVESRRDRTGVRHFRAFERHIVGTLEDSARLFDRRGHVGYPLAWKPQLWDPRISLNSYKITYFSPEGSLPDWLSWDSAGVLRGTPPAATTHPIVIRTTARLVENSVEKIYSNTFDLMITDYCPEVSPVALESITVSPPRH